MHMYVSIYIYNVCILLCICWYWQYIYIYIYIIVILLLDYICIYMQYMIINWLLKQTGIQTQPVVFQDGGSRLICGCAHCDRKGGPGGLELLLIAVQNHLLWVQQTCNKRATNGICGFSWRNCGRSGVISRKRCVALRAKNWARRWASCN